ncbi:regulatory LuxR family protein [Salana multivorans]|uniref:Regulatory LuxR family protein n=1 Tax=Salana multivorans TaxID=120377 RepID=A0A3N2D180_9MICO|nr:regulatory LuxR family protein [Salana multivorans]
MPVLAVRPDRAELLGRAIRDARAGRPRLVCVEGAAGTGKTSHLRALPDLAPDFRVLATTAAETPYRPAYGVLEQLGVPRVVADDGRPHHPAVAAQSLRRLLDDESRGDPLLLMIDDAQWADDESLDALRLVLSRLSGDRLLVVVASRPFARGEHRAWQRHRHDAGAATVLTLDGLDDTETAELLRRATGKEPAPTLVHRLREHTGGNPMHLRALASEYQLDALAAMPNLPAPEDVALELTARLTAMDTDATRLLRAVAVVGASWVDRFDAAAVAGLPHPLAALDLLVEDGLLVVEEEAQLSRVRIVHSLVRAAVYQSTPAAERRELHHRAAESLSSPMRRLEHAVAAAEDRDDGLADRLEAAAAAAHAESDYRGEAQLLLWASRVARSADRRERAWLEAQLATVLALDTQAVRGRLSEIGWARDAALRTVVLAWLLVVENRVADARRALEAVPTGVVERADERTRSRLLVLRAWTMLVSGYPTDRIAAVLDSLPPGVPDDHALRGYYLRTAGQVAARELDFDHVQRDFDAVPTAAGETRLADTDKLAWRGAVYALCGFAAEGRRDLGEVVSRIRGGRVDAGSGANHALYAFTLWLDGELDRAAVEFQAALDLAPERPHPIVQAALPLVPAVRGDARADELLAESESVVRDLPWHEAIAVHVQAGVVRLHAGDDDAARAGWLDHLRSVFGPAIVSPSSPAGAIWHLNVALARVWAGELDEIDAHLVAIETDMIVPAWSAWARPWLIGLRAEGTGDDAGALELLRAAVTGPDTELPLYRAHAHADLARVAARTGDDATATASASRARRLYRRLGAQPYLARLGADASTPRPVDLLSGLSDREREVAALLLAGLSYAQIAEELYVTRSTVAFHLGNVYAKTGVGSRHELVRAARATSGEG